LKELQQIDSIYRRIKEDYQQRHVRYNNSDIDAEEWAVVSAVLRAARDKAMRKKCAVSFSGAQKQTTEIDGFLVQAEASFALCDVLKEHLLSSLGAY
jgi:ABC-type lipopolysaccharide export system ATPase subunit